MVLLAIAAIVVFVGTRQFAVWQRNISRADAGVWYSQGRTQLDENRVEEAVVSLRRAHNRNPGDREYAFTFAHALSAAGRADDARRVLVSLRESSPEDPDINLELARLAATQEQVVEATRYFHSALYGVWPNGQEAERRSARVELVRFLLRHDERTSAVAELIALTTNLPDTASDRVEAGQLMLEAGEPQRALDQFNRALSLAPDDGDALSGAGDAAFRLGDYAGARRFLLRVGDPTPRQVEQRDLAIAVIEDDPLAVKLTDAERRRRLVALLDAQIAWIEACQSRTSSLSSDSRERLNGLQRELTAVDAQFQLRSHLNAGETLDAAFDTMVSTGEAAAGLCGEPVGKHRVLSLIRRLHQGQRQ
ncbi:MAG: tetratricopeptide repeat protein [Vicinamibacterales bacterium]